MNGTIKKTTTLLNSVLLAVLISMVCFFLFVRFLDIVAFANYIGIGYTSASLLGGVLLYAFNSRYTGVTYMFRRHAFSLLAIVWLKHFLDGDLQSGLAGKQLIGHVSVIINADSDIGISTSKRLLEIGSSVVMGCRCIETCIIFTKKVKELDPQRQYLIKTMEIKLEDLGSVTIFADYLLRHFQRLDVLVFSPDSTSDWSQGRRVSGVDQAFNDDYVGRFALTKLLLKLLLKPIKHSPIPYASRVVHVGLGYTSLSDCPNFRMYGRFSNHGIGSSSNRTKSHGTALRYAYDELYCYRKEDLINLWHVYELQRRVDNLVNAFLNRKRTMTVSRKKYRRLVASSLSPGITHCSTFGKQLLRTDISRLFLRTSDQASYVILHAILDNSFLPGSHIDSMKNNFALGNQYLAKQLLAKHITAFPMVANLPFVTKRYNSPGYCYRSKVLQRMVRLYYSWYREQWSNPLYNKSYEHNNICNGAIGMLRDYPTGEVAEWLWSSTDNIISNWTIHQPVIDRMVAKITGRTTTTL